MVIWVKILIVVIALLHLYFLWLEMFVWTTKAKKVFRSLPDDLFEKTKVLAANQGLYNGFLTAGLIWSVVLKMKFGVKISLSSFQCVWLLLVVMATTLRNLKKYFMCKLYQPSLLC